MIITDNEETLVLKTGKKLRANCGIIGIDMHLSVFGGYDDGLYDQDFTIQEKRELAEYMISRWKMYGGIHE